MYFQFYLAVMGHMSTSGVAIPITGAESDVYEFLVVSVSIVTLQSVK